MTSILLDHLADHVYSALKVTFSEIVRANPGRRFYAFAVFTDSDLQFLYGAANTEDALTSTVERYREKYGSRYTRAGMRWSYGEWGFFPGGTEHFEEINKALIANIDGPRDEYEARVGELWNAVLSGFQRLEKEGLFGLGPDRSKITLLLVGDVPPKLVERWVVELNPPDVANRFINWDANTPDGASENG
ncbi:MAG: DUF4303 domain-containing protein [Phycisphaerae bacterium]